jgi:predicted GIY-YIG superfamily endonuclease
METYLVYLLQNTVNGYTYVGMTNNLPRRIRQHNGFLVGGAKYTSRNKGAGEWFIYGTINGLNKIQAYSIEKKIQIRSRKVKGGKPIDRRLEAIKQILNFLWNNGTKCF